MAVSGLVSAADGMWHEQFERLQPVLCTQMQQVSLATTAHKATILSAGI